MATSESKTLFLLLLVCASLPLALSKPSPKHSPRDGHGNWNKNDEEHEEHEGYPIFHVDFPHVEVPFIVALWLLVASLGKAGKFYRTCMFK